VLAYYPASPAGHSPLAANCLPNFPWPPIHPWLHVRVQLTALVAGALYIATLQRKRWQGALALRNRNQPYIYMHPTFPILVLYWHHSSAFASTVPDHVSAPVHPTSSCDQSERKKDLKHEPPARFYFYTPLSTGTRDRRLSAFHNPGTSPVDIRGKICHHLLDQIQYVVADTSQ